MYQLFVHPGPMNSAASLGTKSLHWGGRFGNLNPSSPVEEAAAFEQQYLRLTTRFGHFMLVVQDEAPLPTRRGHVLL
jgi:hypothetical protein